MGFTAGWDWDLTSGDGMKNFENGNGIFSFSAL